MQLHLKLLLLLAALTNAAPIVSHAAVAEGDEVDDPHEGVADSENPDITEGHDSPDGPGPGDEHAIGGDDVDEEAAGEDDGTASEEHEEDDEEMDPIDPLSSEQMRALHKKIDVNSNGKVSLAEVTEFAHKMRRHVAKIELTDVMAEHDKNKDGKLTFEEFLGDPGKHSEEAQNEKQTEFKELDVNNDKVVDADELAALYHHHTNDKVETHLTNVAMKDKDLDKNGAISLQEFYQHLQMEEEEPVEISEEDKDTFKKLDLDGSGSLTLKELKAWESGGFSAEEAVKKIFQHADKDKDGVLTGDELDKAKEDIANDHDVDAQMYLSQWAEHHEHGEL